MEANLDPSLDYCRVTFDGGRPKYAREIAWFRESPDDDHENDPAPDRQRRAMDKALYSRYPFKGLPIPLSTPFANIDAVVDFSERVGGLLAPSEFEAYYAIFSGEFCLEALAYVLYRFPQARTLLVEDEGNEGAEYYGQRGYGALPAWVPGLATRAEAADGAIARRFGEGVDLLVCDLGFRIQDQELALGEDGFLVAVSPPDPRDRELSWIVDIASRFEEWTFFHPFGFLGGKAVVCARKPRKRASVNAASVHEKVRETVSVWRASSPASWWDRNLFDHTRAAVCWNIV